MALLTVSEAAERLGLTPARMYVFIKAGRIKSSETLGRIAINEKELDRFAAVERPHGRPNGARKRK